MKMTKEQREIIDRYVKNPEWRVMARRADFAALAERFGIDPVVARVIVNRGVMSAGDIDMYLNGDVTSMHDPALMKDLPEGCAIIYRKLQENRRIRIISDYDVDGVCSNFILLKGMERAWRSLHGDGCCKAIDYDIPHRIHDGYGINKRLIDAAYADGVDTIITCDNGIAAYEQTRYAKELSLTVIITDHHQVPYEETDGTRRYVLPPADAVIDIQREDCSYPFKGLCGAGVAYKFIQYLYRMCGIAESETEEFMEILGLATNCDMMDLIDENRVYVKRALSTLRNSTNPGINALMRLSGRSERRISTFDLGFLIGPCINAAGRLGDARTSLEFLLEENPAEAAAKAQELLDINNERKSMTDEGEALLRRQLEEATLELCGTAESGETLSQERPATLADKVIAAYIPAVHESVVGIIASRLKEAYSRPVLVFTDGEEAGILKGSGRSIEPYNMFEELSRVKELFTAFGGHAMAAGFSIRKSDLGELRRRLNELTRLTDRDITPRLMIDIRMPLSYNSVCLTEQLGRLEPYGKGNRRPLFAWAGVHVRRAQLLGAKKNLLRLELESEDGYIVTAKKFSPETFLDSIKQWFGEDECVKMLNGQKNNVVINAAYYPQINEFNGRRSLELMLEAYAKG